jgi:hypothetical protein
MKVNVRSIGEHREDVCLKDETGNDFRGVQSITIKMDVMDGNSAEVVVANKVPHIDVDSMHFDLDIKRVTVIRVPTS